MKHTLILTLALLVGGGLILVQGCRKKCSPEDRINWLSKKISSKLDLNKEQNAVLEKTKNEIIAKRKEFHAVGEEIFSEIFSQLKNEKMDEDKINRLFDDKSEKIREFRKFLVAKAVSFHSILTPKQKETLKEKVKEHREKHKKYCTH